MERRKGDRREVRLTCYVGSPGMGINRLTGVSENISRSGILLTVQECANLPDSIGVGQAATVEVPLPVEHDLGARCMHFEGRVVRIASRNEEIHIAVRFKNLRFGDLLRGPGRLGTAAISKYLM